jgi:hypothetical protein
MVDVDNDAKRIIHDLQTVRSYGEFPKGRNYLFSRYKHEGLVIMGGHKKIGTGKNARMYVTEKSKVKLTKKGYAIVKVANKHNQFMGEL